MSTRHLPTPSRVSLSRGKRTDSLTGPDAGASEPHPERERVVRVCEAVAPPHKSTVRSERLDQVIGSAILRNPDAALLQGGFECFMAHVGARETGLGNRVGGY